MADKPPTLPPPAEPFPGSRTPGWNDPPTLQYTLPSPAASGGRPKLNLNKRVPFPLQGMGGTPGSKPTAIVQPNQSSMSPTPTMQLPTCSSPVVSNFQPVAVVHPMSHMTTQSQIPPSTSSPTEGNNNIAALPNDIQEYTLRSLREQIGQVTESLNVRREELERRLEFMEQLWQSGNLSAEAQQKIYQLSNEKNFKKAMDMYTSLVINHSSECTSWAIALRHIILTIQPTNNTAEEVATDVMMVREGNVPAMLVTAMPRLNSNQTTPASLRNENSDQSAMQQI